MQAEHFRNPFQANPDVRPVLVIYQDANPYPPHDLLWMASIDCMDVHDAPEEHEATGSGFQVRGVGAEGSCPLQFEIREELVSALQAAGYGDLDLYGVVLARIHGEDICDYLGKVSDAVPSALPSP